MGMSEKALQSAVVEAAQYGGWLVHFVADSRRSPAGWPDLTLVHMTTGRVIYAELKTARGRLTIAQAVWLDALRIRGDARVVRPGDLPALAAELIAERNRG